MKYAVQCPGLTRRSFLYEIHFVISVITFFNIAKFNLLYSISYKQSLEWPNLLFSFQNYRLNFFWSLYKPGDRML